MKIHKVELQGFGPFRDREVVDFDAFEADGIFLITGRTGAGKTSILDAVTYALFGRLPRYDEAAADKVRSDHISPTDICEVALEFSVPAGRHRVTRSPAHERPKKRGVGTTAVKARFELAVHRGGAWEVLETKEGNADRHVSDVVPLTAEQFQQVILLAQGEFQQFLVADSQARRELLSKLFDTSRFTAYCDDLQGRARELKREVDRGSAQFGALLSGMCEQLGAGLPAHVDPETGVGVVEWLDEVLAEQDASLEEVRSRQVEVESTLDGARRELREGQELAGRQRRLADAMTLQDQLATRSDEVETAREAVLLARRAAVAAQAVRSLETAHAGERSRRAGVVTGETAYEETVGRRAPVARKADEELASLAALLGSLEDARRDETTLPALEMACTLAREAVTRHDAQVAAMSTERGQLQEELVVLDARVVVLAEVIAAHDEAPVELERAGAGLAAANEHAALGERLVDALSAQRDAAEEHERLTRLHTDLVSRQFAEYAGVLARDLVDGADCPVCGSTAHPAKAPLDGDHVSVEQVEAARAAVELAAKQVSEEAAEVAKVRTKLEAAGERCQGRTVEEWQSDVASATELVRARTEAVAEREALVARRPQAMSRTDELASLLEATRREGSLLTSEVAVAEQKRDAALERVVAARGKAASVGARVAEIERERNLLAQVVDARARLTHAEEDVTRAHTTLEEVLGEQRFDTAEAVSAAHLDADALARAEGLVADHDARVTAVKRELASPDLQDVPADHVDIEVLTTAERAANTAHLDVVRESARTANRHSLAHASAARLRSSLAATEQVRQEYSTVNSLAETLRGQGQNERKIMLESFALAAELEDIVEAANGRLSKMTDGRYEFRHSDARAARGAQSGLALDVLDSHTGEARSPKSLSGGEKFQASLALALGLAEVVTSRAGGIRLDTLFIDEGFGTLDPETLESTMATLDSLREGGRTVGLISHVATLKESIPAQLHVEVTPGGWSTLAQV